VQATEDNGRYWDRWRARDYQDRSHTVVCWVFLVLAAILHDTHNSLVLGVAGFVAGVAAQLHARLAAMTASLHRRFDEQHARDTVR
jgi:hypothetical protein